MKKEVLKRFKKLFEQQKASVLFNDKVIRDDFAVNSDNYDLRFVTPTNQADR